MEDPMRTRKKLTQSVPEWEGVSSIRPEAEVAARTLRIAEGSWEAPSHHMRRLMTVSEVELCGKPPNRHLQESLPVCLLS